MGKAARRARGAGKASFLERVARRPLASALVLVAVVLAGTVDERLFGLVTDEQQMLTTGVSMAEFGEIGIARGQLFMVHRPEGDAVSPYGMGTSLILALPALIAGKWEHAFGEGASQTLFVLVPLALILAGAAFAGLLARDLGGGPSGTVVAVLGASVASPLWAYAGTAYSEPLQGTALVGAAFFALRAARESAENDSNLSRNMAAAGAGLLAGLALLAKSVNLLAAPLTLLPVLFGGGSREPWRNRVTRVLSAAAGALVPAASWLAFEVVRFGRPFTSYGGQDFSHPFLDGLVRLLAGPNKGLVVFFPLLVLAVGGLLLLAREPGRRLAAVALGGPFLVLLLVTASWWAWDGTVGWGPRFLVPAVPLLAAAAGVAAARLPWPAASAAFVGAGVLVNLLGVLAPDTALSAWVLTAPGSVLSPEEVRLYPSFYLERRADGRTVLPREFNAASDPAFSHLRLGFALLRLKLRAGSAEEREEGLRNAPWLHLHPDLVPHRTGTDVTTNAATWVLRGPFRWPFLGRASLGAPELDETFNRAWATAQADQVLRNVDLGRADRAVALAERLFELSPSGYAAALQAESLRASGRLETAEAFLRSLPPPFRSSPSLGVVSALIARDRGDERAARSILESVARVFPRPALVAALTRPLAQWPASLHRMTGENLETRELSLPKLGSGSSPGP